MLPEEYVIKSNALFTANEREPHPGYVYVKGSEIAEVGTLEELEEHPHSGTEVIDAGDSLVMPGFNDAHMHFALASVQHDPDYCVDLLFAESERACLDRVREFDETHPGDGWIYGWGWYSAVWDNPIDPTKDGLDSLGIDRPICLDDFSMHVAWLNSKALEMVGITKDTPDPEGGIIRRDDEGNPTGILCEPAATDIANNVVLNVPDLKSSLVKSMRQLNALGITSVGDMHPLGVANKDVYETYQQIADDGEATLRVSFFPDMTDVEAAKAERSKHHGDVVRCGGLKLISDGAVEAYTAYMAEPYLNAPEGPGYRGECIYSQDELDEIVDKAVAAGFNPRIHAIGDGAASMVLNSYEKALAKYGRKGTRYCIEHGDNFKAEDIKRLANLNGCFAIQPQHPIGGFPEGLYPIILGKERTAHMWRYREMLEGGGSRSG
jgi:predicted amidohydrolase YtcJ